MMRDFVLVTHVLNACFLLVLIVKSSSLINFVAFQLIFYDSALRCFPLNSYMKKNIKQDEISDDVDTVEELSISTLVVQITEFVVILFLVMAICIRGCMVARRAPDANDVPFVVPSVYGNNNVFNVDR